MTNLRFLFSCCQVVFASCFLYGFLGCSSSISGGLSSPRAIDIVGQWHGWWDDYPRRPYRFLTHFVLKDSIIEGDFLIPNPGKFLPSPICGILHGKCYGDSVALYFSGQAGFDSVLFTGHLYNYRNSNGNVTHSLLMNAFEVYRNDIRTISAVALYKDADSL